jgi:hypothetical protein
VNVHDMGVHDAGLHDVGVFDMRRGMHGLEMCSVGVQGVGVYVLRGLAWRARTWHGRA